MQCKFFFEPLRLLRTSDFLGSYLLFCQGLAIHIYMCIFLDRMHILKEGVGVPTFCSQLNMPAKRLKGFL